MTKTIYQSAHNFTVGKGPGKCGAVGCVVCSCTMILQDLGIAPALTPLAFNDAALLAGAFTGDVLNSGVALNAWQHVHAEEKMLSDLLMHRDRIMKKDGRLLVRVAFNDFTPNGNHTIAGIKLMPDKTLMCLDPAIGPVILDAHLRANVKWRDVPKSYRAVNLRGVFKV